MDKQEKAKFELLSDEENEKILKLAQQNMNKGTNIRYEALNNSHYQRLNQIREDGYIDVHWLFADGSFLLFHGLHLIRPHEADFVKPITTLTTTKVNWGKTTASVPIFSHYTIAAAGYAWLEKYDYDQKILGLKQDEVNTAKNALQVAEKAKDIAELAMSAQQSQSTSLESQAKTLANMQKDVSNTYKKNWFTKLCIIAVGLATVISAILSIIALSK